MAQNRSLNFEPVYVSNAIGNIYNCKFTTVTGGVGNPQVQPYTLIKHIRITNSGSSAATVSLYKGATAGSTGSTEFAFAGTSIPGNSYVDWYGSNRFDSADFLSGIAGTESVLTINIDGEVGLSG